MYIDSHAHLEGEEYDEDREAVLQRAAAAGVRFIVDPGTSLASSSRALELASRSQQVLPAVGVHPHDAADWGPEMLEQLRALCRQSPVAIGEIGMDFYRDYSPRDAQQRAFDDQLALAEEMDLPVLVHCRQAHSLCFELLERHPGLRGVMHCFTGSPDDARHAIDMGFLVSFTGRITYAGAHDMRAAAEAVPPERLLIETDCPYMTPRPHKGRNEPAFVPLVAQALAKLYGLSTDDIARITTHNAAGLFGIEVEPDRDAITYPIRDSLYVNLTNRCTNECVFCPRSKGFLVKGHTLRLEREPTAEEVTAAIGDPTRYCEIVFCGFGEPTLRLDELKQIAQYVKTRGGRVRVNTNGQGDLIHGRSIAPELRGLVDAVSVSLNSSEREQYAHLCPSRFGAAAYDAVLQFVRDAVAVFPDVTVTAIDYPGVDIAACERLAQSLGAKFRLRRYNVVG